MYSNSVPSTTTLDTSPALSPVTTPATPAGQVEPVYSTIVPRSQRADNASRGPTASHAATTVHVPANSSSGRPKEDTAFKLRLQYLEGMVSRLDKEKKGMEEEFGRQRKKFIQQMMQTEGQTNLLKQSLEKHVKQIDSLNKMLQAKDDEIKHMTKTINASLQETFDADRLKYEQEIALLKHMIQESSHEHQVEMEKLKAQLSREKKPAKEKQISESNLQQQLLEVESIMSNSSGVRSPSGWRSPSGRRSPQLISSGQRTPVGETSSAINFSSETSLETSMIKAAEDARLLKSVIVPLEEEIDMLKMQLGEAQERLKVYEGKSSASLSVSAATDLNSTTESLLPRQAGGASPENGGDAELYEKLLHQERAARLDLEMHIEGLHRQKTQLQSDTEELKDKLIKSQKALENEQNKYKDLKDTWKKANVLFITNQDQLHKELRQIKEDEERKHKENLLSVGAYSPRSSPVRPHSQTLGTGTRPQVKSIRRRTVSWSEGDCRSEENKELATWRAVTEQVQRLLSEQHHELQSKDATITLYEKQLERTQGQLMADIDDKDDEIFKMRKEVEKIQAALLRERRQRDQLKRSLSALKEDMKAKIETFQDQESKLKLKQKTFKDKFTEIRHDIQKQLAEFTEERTRLFAMNDQKTEEYECLKQLQTNERLHYEMKIQQLDQAKKEAELNVASTVEELTRLRDEMTKMESQLTNEVSDLQKLIAATRKEKSSLEEQLTASVNETVEIQKVNTDLERQRHDAILSRTNLQEKSKDFIEDQQIKIAKLTQEKEESEIAIKDLKRQLAQLKLQLSNSESVQKDFVELSQSLQVRLIEAESRQNEEADLSRLAEVPN